MTPTIAQIDVSTDIAAPRAAVFAHWMDPQARQRYEAPPESGMRYRNFSGKAGGVEEIEITHAGQVIGEMIQHLVVVEAPQLIISQITGTFNGATTMAIQVTVRFEEAEKGTRIFGTGQVVDTTGQDVKPLHEAGWHQLFVKFAEDFASHGTAG